MVKLPKRSECLYQISNSTIGQTGKAVSGRNGWPQQPVADQNENQKPRAVFNTFKRPCAFIVVTKASMSFCTDRTRRGSHTYTWRFTCCAIACCFFFLLLLRSVLIAISQYWR